MSARGGVAVVGEVVMDLVPAASGEGQDPAPGGSPANVAVTLARLDVPVRLHARLSTDGYGQQIRAHLEGNDVDLAMAVSAEEPTPVASVGVGPDGGPTYDFRVEGAADWQWTDDELADALDGVVHLHAGSLAVTQPPGGAAVRRLMERTSSSAATLSYDPNSRPLLMGDVQVVRPLVESLVARSDIVKVSHEDLTWLAAGEPAREVVARWQQLGPAVVILTLGAPGAFAVNASGSLTRPGRPVEVVDTVGAGDSFMGALIAGLWRRGLLGAEARPALRSMSHETLGSVLDEAIHVSSITCSRRGADPPRLSELS